MILIYGTFFNLPDNWFAVMSDYASALFSDMSPILLLVMAILLATFIIEWLISILR